jgi:hypothetical protein
VHCARLDEVSSTTPPRHWRIRGGNATSAYDVNRITTPDLYLATSREVGEALGQEDQPFARQSEPHQKCLVEDEDHGHIGMS